MYSITKKINCKTTIGEIVRSIVSKKILNNSEINITSFELRNECYNDIVTGKNKGSNVLGEISFCIIKNKK